MSKLYNWYNEYYNKIEKLKNKNYLEYESQRAKMYKRQPPPKTFESTSKTLMNTEARMLLIQKMWNEKMEYKMSKDPNKVHPSENLKTEHTMRDFINVQNCNVEDDR